MGVVPLPASPLSNQADPSGRRGGAAPRVVTVISCPAVLRARVRAHRPEKPVVVSPSRVDGLVALVTGVQQGKQEFLLDG